MPEDFPPLDALSSDMAPPPLVEDDAAGEADADLVDATAIAGGDEELGAMLLELIDRRLGGGSLPL